MRFNRKGYYFASGMISIISAIFLAISLGTPKWIEADIDRKIQRQQPNSTVEVFKAGYKYIGMFRGCEQKKYANYFAVRERCFDAFEELKLIAGTELAYTTLVCCCLSLSSTILSIYIAFYNELVHSVPHYLQTYVPCITLTSSFILKVTAFGTYVYLYNNYLKISLLDKTSLLAGFSTEGKANLGYSFWLMVASTLTSLLSMMIICISHQRNKKTQILSRQRNNHEQENDIPMQAGKTNEAGMMIF